MKKALTLLLAFAVICTIATACNKTNDDPTTQPTAPAEPKELTLGFAYDATTLDVQNMTDDGSYSLMYLLGEGLVRNDTGVIEPGVAERWDVSADGLTLTFYLRKNATWSDGSPLNAYDFEYTFMRVIDPDLGLQNAEGSLKMFKNARAYYEGSVSIDQVGIKAVDEYTLKIELEIPSLETLFTLAEYGYYPINKAMAEANGKLYGTEPGKVLTNGPFTLIEWRFEDSQVLVKNENYWNKDAINLDKLTRRVGLAADVALDMMLVGELDEWSFDDINQVNTLVNAGFTSIPYVVGYQFVHMNSNGCTTDSKRFMENTNFRKALNYAVNREGITNSIYPGAEPVYRWSSPTMMGVSKLFHEEYPYQAWPTSGDAAKAKECLDLALQEIGATLSDVPELSLLCYDSQRGITVLTAVQDMLLSTLGIKSKVDPQPIQQMLDKADNGEWDMWWGGKQKGDLDWVQGFGGDFDYRSEDDASGYKNARYLELLDKAKSALSMKERKDIVFEMEKILCEDPPSVLIGWTKNWLVLRSDITGVLPDGFVVFWQYADIVR